MKTNKFKLKEYSLISSAFLFMHSPGSSEIVYTDIEPDIDLNVNGETAFIDMDNNGTLDFAFLLSKGTFTTYTYTAWSNTFVERVRYVWAGPYVFGNKIAGGVQIHTSYSWYYWFLPYSFVYGVLINGEWHFDTYGFQVMAGIVSQQFTTGGWIATTYHGGWFGKDNYYLGVYFADSENLFHYGWIRCSVSDSADELIIKDYAYNTEPGQGLFAGTLLSGIHETPGDLHADVYAYDNSIHIHLPEPGAQVQILNLNGEKLIEQTMDNTDAEIDMRQYPAGVYLVELTEGDKKFSKKVVIE